VTAKQVLQWCEVVFKEMKSTGAKKYIYTNFLTAKNRNIDFFKRKIGVKTDYP
jgi:hypothetical protein